MNEALFMTREAAEAHQDECYTLHMAGCVCGLCGSGGCCCADYRAQTTRWDTPRQRIDGLWGVLCHPDYDYTGMTVVPFDKANYPEPSQ